MYEFRTTAEAVRAASAALEAHQCATGRHAAGCPHRPVPAWVARALNSPSAGGTLPAKVYR